MVTRQALAFPVPKAVEAAVARLANPNAVFPDDQCGKRGAHAAAALYRSADVENVAIGRADRGDDGFDGFFGAMAVVDVDEGFGGEFAGNLPGGVPAHSVADEEGGTSRGEDGVVLRNVVLKLVFVVFTNPAEVALCADPEPNAGGKLRRLSELGRGVFSRDVIRRGCFQNGFVHGSLVRRLQSFGRFTRRGRIRMFVRRWAEWRCRLSLRQRSRRARRRSRWRWFRDSA